MDWGGGGGEGVWLWETSPVMGVVLGVGSGDLLRGGGGSTLQRRPPIRSEWGRVSRKKVVFTSLILITVLLLALIDVVCLSRVERAFGYQNTDRRVHRRNVCLHDEPRSADTCKGLGAGYSSRGGGGERLARVSHMRFDFS